MRSIRLFKWVLAGATSLAMVALAPVASYSMGDPPAPAPDKCKQFKEGSTDWKRCKGQKKLREDHEATYARGYQLAKAGEFAAALDVLRSARDQSDPRVQTMIGFALRNIGMVDEGIAYYHAALSANPNLTTTRQYLGEAFLQKGESDKAREQLAQIEIRCGTSCEDYVALAAAIAKGI